MRKARKFRIRVICNCPLLKDFKFQYKIFFSLVWSTNNCMFGAGCFGDKSPLWFFKFLGLPSFIPCMYPRPSTNMWLLLLIEGLDYSDSRDSNHVFFIKKQCIERLDTKNIGANAVGCSKAQIIITNSPFCWFVISQWFIFRRYF